MESLQQIKQRVKSVKNINQITKAMELVAATKMRKSQEIALRSRAYAYAALDFLRTLTKMENVALPPLLARRAVKRHMVVLVTSDKGLAGAFNSNVIRAFERWIGLEAKSSKLEAIYVAVGQKAKAHLERFVSLHASRSTLHANFVRVGDYTTVEEVRPIAELIIKSFLDGECDEVILFSTHFRSALRQEVLQRKILPVSFESITATLNELVPEHGRFTEANQPLATSHQPLVEYLIEPSAETILDDLARHLVLMEIYHVILEANASEHAARRLAMKSASDNARDIVQELNLAYNKSRQAAITKELTEITAGSESLS